MTKFQQHIYCLLIVSISVWMNLKCVQAQESLKANELLTQITNESTIQSLNLKKSGYIKKKSALKKLSELLDLNEKNIFVSQKMETDDLGRTHQQN